MTKRRHAAAPRRYWTAKELRILRAKYPHMQTAKLLPLLPGRTATTIYQTAARFGLSKSAAYLASAEAHRLDGKIGSAYRFSKGHVPANKGLRRPGWGPGRMKQTQFKPGSRSVRWNPEDYAVGALRINADGQLDMKVREGLRAWERLSRWVWTTERGPIPKNGVIRCINGDEDDCRIENLRLTTRAQLMRENTYHRYPKEIARLVQLRGAITRQINKREKQNGDHA